TVDVKGEKTWNDNNNQDGKRPEKITVKLMKKVGNAEAVVAQTQEVREGADKKWTYEFKNLPKYEKGTEITYSIEEEAVAGYVGALSGYNLTNTHTPETVDVKGEKTWDDANNQDGKRPKSITVKLIKQVENGQPVEVQRKEVKEGPDKKWTYEFKNLPKYENGKEIKYTIDEEEVTGYTKTIDGTNIKNSYTPGKVNISGEKTWDDNDNQDGKRPEKITVILKKTVDGKTSEVIRKDVTPDTDGKWKYEFADLPLYEGGKPIEYSIDEEKVDGYDKVPSRTTNGPDYNLTNKHTPETVDVSGEKTWDDANNQDGKRPTSIKVKLIKKVGDKDPEVVETKEVTKGADDKWKYEFKGLPKYENGKEITYSIDEEKVEGYTKTIDGTNIKNSYTPGKVSIKVTKAWEDKDNQDGVRPASVTIKLLADGVEVPGKTLTLTEANNWTGSFTDLDEYKDGTKIVYTVKEENVGNGYNSNVIGSPEDGFKVINTRQTEKVNVEGKKTWDDKENQDGKRPKEIKINLLKNGKVLETKTVTEKDGWKWKFENLDKYEKGQEIKYTISEEQVKDYTTEVTGYNVKNSYTPGKTSVQVTKAWEDKNNQDGKRPASVTVKLLADGVETGDKLTLTEANNWTGSFTDLDEYKGGKKIVYTVKEETVGNGYESKVTGSAKDGFTVTNTREPEKTFVEGSKTWDDKNDQDGKRPKEITINLLKNGKVFKTKTVTEKDGWKWKFEDLDKYENGEVINYTITEEQVEGYTTVVTGHNVKNSYTPGKTSVQVTKAWEDKNNQDGVRPASVTIRLIADGQPTDKTLTLTEANNWTGSFTDLDEYKAGKKIEYTVKEEAVENGYDSKVTGSAKDGFTVTNTREPEKTEVEGSKTWEDANNQDGKRPKEIKINLLKNGTVVETKTVTEKDGWKWKFENLDKYENGELINYTITEEKVEEYTTVVKGSDVINTHAPGKTSVQVTKAWKDNNNQDGARPGIVTVRLVADGQPTDKTVTLTKDNNWTGSFTDLDEYKNGKKIVYTVKEENVGNGYTSVVTKTGENNFIVTNTREPEKIFVEGSKTWDDANNQDGKRPTEITVNLLKNGKKVATKKVTEKDGWKWKFENLDKYENGELINYTIVEEKVEGYTTEVEGYNVKNSYTPGKTSVQVTKAWKDNNDQDKKRPDSVTIELLADGKETGKKVILTKENNWTGSFTDLDEYKDGKKIEYTVKEKAVGNGYKSVITGNAKEGFVVTNVRTPKPRIPKTGAGSNSALYTVLLGLSGTALFSVFRRKRKEEI
ncbi:Cna B-type domain-containing protein, partial [Parvimonas sp. G1967]|uniref:Cna B-type domain-containing protein n=1 Tax=Parvimonas sp. G1967 TaxID=3387695 RepID=UPI0039E5E3AB